MIGESFGNYRVTGKLGEGGMGAVYLAEHTSLGRRAAIKVLLPEHSRRPELVDRFFTEARTLANLRHPAFVEVYDFGVHASGSAYLVMDCLEGETVARRIERRGRLPCAEALDIVRRIATALQVAHAQRIVHRDLKPENVFLVSDPEDPTRERVKILDFGIAKLLDGAGAGGAGSKGATQTGMILGTPLFMAPEQCRGSGLVDHRADVYALGCIFYAMLVGHPPFPYEGVGEILGAHLYEPPKSLRSLDPSIPEEVDALVQKMLEKKPDARLGSMAEVAAVLTGLGARGTAMAATAGTPVPPAPAAQGPALASAPTMLAGGGVTGRAAGVAAQPTTLLSAAGEQPATTRGTEPRPKRGLVIGVAAVAVVAVGVGFALTRGRSPAPVAVEQTVAPVPRPQPPAAEPKPAAVPAAPKAEPAAEPKAEPAVEPKAEPAVQTKAEPAVEANAEPAVEPPVVASPEPAPKEERKPRAAPKAVAPKNDPATAAYSRAVVLLARGDEPGALVAFRRTLRGERLPADVRADAERNAIALGRRLGEIEVVTDVPGAEVTVDGVSRGRTPIDEPIIVRPGTHELVLAKPGLVPVRKTVAVGPGERKPFRFKLR